MFKKMNIKTLLIAFIVLLAVVIIIKISDSKKGERNIKIELVKFDPEEVTSVKIIKHLNPLINWQE